MVAPYLGGSSLHLGSILKRRRGRVRSVVSERPTAAQIEEVVTKASSADVVVLASYYRPGHYPVELARLGAISATCKPLVLVSTGNPDDARLVTGPQAYPAYGYREATREAASDVLLGRTVPRDRLPVPINPSVGPSSEGC